MDDELNASAEAPAADTTPVETTDAAPDTAAETTDADSAEDAWDADLRGIFEKNSRERDATGRFAKPNSDQSPTAENGEPAEAPAIPVPQSWSADAKAKWASLPPDLKTYLSKRDQEVHEHISQQGRQIASLEPLQRAAELGKQTFEKYGVPVEEGISQLLQANEYLERDAPSAIRDLAKAYGVDLRALTGNQPGNVPQPVQQLHDRIAQLERQLNETSNRVTTREKAEYDRQTATVESQIAEFAKDKDDFEALQDEILDHIVILKQKNPDAPHSEIIAKAYDKARWANPDSRAKALEAEEAKRLKAAKERSNDAKRVAPLNVRTSTANSRSPKSLDDDLEAIAKRVYG